MLPVKTGDGMVWVSLDRYTFWFLLPTAICGVGTPGVELAAIWWVDQIGRRTGD
jgi:hypothetical protein